MVDRTFLPYEALTPLAYLSQSFSLLSLWERRAGVVKASEGMPS
jgi:hypothetical protein